MNTRTKNIHILPIISVSLLALSSLSNFGDQPQSTITPTGEQYELSAATNDPANNITFSTAQTPTPNCPDDTPDGDPDYYWDFGPLDGVDNGDGTADMYDDVVGEYDVTVYCEQSFIDSTGSEYTVDTQTSP